MIKAEIGLRLREERDRLGLSQAQLASATGAATRTHIAWEKGEQTPNAVYLATMFIEGVDVNYVITGQRALTGAALQDELENLSSAWQAIDEALVSAKKTMPPDKKRLAAEAIYNAVKADGCVAKPLAELLTKAA